MPLETLTTADIVRVLYVFREALAVHRSTLNRLNVYPVPDGDTGTNMGFTVDAVIAELDISGRGNGSHRGDTDATNEAPFEGGAITAEALAEAMTHGSLMGARGNSGVILSQVMRGLASAFRDAPGAGLGPAGAAKAFQRAADGAYAAVSNPVEGTILTVARAAAEGATCALDAASPHDDKARDEKAHDGSSGNGSSGNGSSGNGSCGNGDDRGGGALLRVLDSARDAASRALAGTTKQLPALAAAGVVDAGGAGLLLLFDSFLRVADGREVPAPPGPAPGNSTAEVGTRAESGWQGALPARPSIGTGDLRYEVMFFLEAPDEAVQPFREVWAGYGGSIVIVGGDGLYNCHIHTDDIGGAIEAAIEIGRPRQIRVTDLAEQVEEERWVREAEAAGHRYEEPPAGPVTTAVVAVCAGEGVKRVFRSLGVRHFVAGGQSANPSTAELLDAIESAGAEQVVVLPNNPNVVPVAEQAASICGKKARVVRTDGIAEGFAALLAYDPEADVDTNADAMATAASRVLPGEVAQATRDAATGAGPVKRGDWLGLSKGEVRAVVPAEAGAAGAAVALLDLLVSPDADYEMVTLIEGEGATPAATRKVLEWLEQARPHVSAEVHHGGQPLYTYVLGVE